MFLKSNWQNQDGGSRWLVHEMGHVWDMNTGWLVPGFSWQGNSVVSAGGIIGGVADRLNGQIGGSVISTPFACRYCDGSGLSNIPSNHQFTAGSYGNNSTADYLAEVFALSVYPDSNNPVPVAAQTWMEWEILEETWDVVVPSGIQW